MQLTSCAMLAIATLSACRLKVSSVSPATRASRIVDCWPKRCAGSRLVVILCHAPHSSTTSFTRRSRSLSPITCQCDVISDSIRLALPARRPLLGERGASRRRIAVLQPLVERARGERAEIDGEIGLSRDQTAEPHELVRAELVGIVLRRHVAQRAQMGIVAPEVGASRPALARTDAVMPIVGVREAAPRPAHHARVDEAERIDQRLPEPADVRDTGLLTH